MAKAPVKIDLRNAKGEDLGYLALILYNLSRNLQIQIVRRQQQRNQRRSLEIRNNCSC